MIGWILAAALLAVVLVEFLAWIGRLPARAAVAGWAARQGLPLDEPAVYDLIRHQLRRGRAARTLGFAVAFTFSVAGLFLARGHSPAPAPVSVLASPAVWAAGYLIGGLVGELTRPHPGPWRLRGARLSPRQLGGYLPAGMLAAERCLSLLVILLAPLAERVDITKPMQAAPARVGLADGLVALTVALVLEVGLRLVVHRAQPVGSAGELAVDDAFRATAVHRALAAALAAQLFLLGEQGTTALSPFESLRAWIWILSGGCFVLALRSWSGRNLPSRWQAR
jgi:hypothetical protein